MLIDASLAYPTRRVPWVPLRNPLLTEDRPGAVQLAVAAGTPEVQISPNVRWSGIHQVTSWRG